MAPSLRRVVLQVTVSPALSVDSRMAVGMIFPLELDGDDGCVVVGARPVGERDVLDVDVELAASYGVSVGRFPFAILRSFL